MGQYKTMTHGITSYSSSEFARKLDSFIHSKNDKIISINMLPNFIANITLREEHYPNELINVEVNVYQAIVIYNQAIY